MEKYVVTPEQKVFETLFKKQNISFSDDPLSTTKNAIVRTFEQLISKWKPSKQNPSAHKSAPIPFRTIHPNRKETIADQILVPQELIEEILLNLKAFEKNKGYLDRDLSLPGLAKSIGTNHSYLSRVVNHIKRKSFKKYLNDLRIEHAYIDLQTNPLKRRYTIEAIAFENGFRSAESFSKKFLAKYGMYPSAFLKKIQDA